jgi:hypothetical protein
VRSDRAIRRYWELVCCAFCFCWWASDWAEPNLVTAATGQPVPTLPAPPVEQQKKDLAMSPPILIWPVALRQVRAWLEPYLMLRRYWCAWSDRLPPPQLQALLDWLWQGQGIYLYVR